jgi:hypothetical protein
MARVICETGTRARGLADTARSVLAALLGEDRIDHLHDHALLGLRRGDALRSAAMRAPNCTKKAFSSLPIGMICFHVIKVRCP